MKNRIRIIIAATAVLALGVFAADRTGVFTRSTTITETKRVTDVHAFYDQLGNLVSITVNWESVKTDSSGMVGSQRGSDVWTQGKIDALQDLVAGETNKFKTQMQARWGNVDNIPENYVTGWKNAGWMTSP